MYIPVWALVIIIIALILVFFNTERSLKYQGVVANHINDKFNYVFQRLERMEQNQKDMIEHNSKVNERFNDVQSTVNHIQRVGDEAYKWNMASLHLVSTTYRLTMASHRRLLHIDLELNSTIRSYNDSSSGDCHEDNWYECAGIIRDNGIGEAKDFLRKVGE